MVLRPTGASFCFPDQLHHPPPRPRPLWGKVVLVLPSLKDPCMQEGWKRQGSPGSRTGLTPSTWGNELSHGVHTAHPHISSWLRGWAQSTGQDRGHLEQVAGHLSVTQRAAYQIRITRIVRRVSRGESAGRVRQGYSSHAPCWGGTDVPFFFPTLETQAQRSRIPCLPSGPYIMSIG